MKKMIFTFAATVLSAGFVFATDAAPPATSTPPPASSATPAKTREQAREEIRAQMERVRNACAADVGNAGCSSQQGRRAIKCVQKYKKKHSEFQLSDSCKTALEEGRQLRNQIKMAKRQRKGKNR